MSEIMVLTRRACTRCGMVVSDNQFVPPVCLGSRAGHEFAGEMVEGYNAVGVELERRMRTSSTIECVTPGCAERLTLEAVDRGAVRCSGCVWDRA